MLEKISNYENKPENDKIRDPTFLMSRNDAFFVWIELPISISSISTPLLSFNNQNKTQKTERRTDDSDK